MKNITKIALISLLIFSFKIGSTQAAPKKKEEIKNTVKATATPKKEEKNTSGLPQNFGKLPTFIKSDSLTLKNETRTFVYSGNVEVTQGDMILTANTMEGSYDEKNKIKDLVAKGNVLITKGPQIRATGEKAIYEAATETVVLSDNPELQQDGSILSADRIRVFLNENRSVAEGTVRMKLIQKDQSAVDTKSVLGK